MLHVPHGLDDAESKRYKNQVEGKDIQSDITFKAESQEKSTK